MLRKIEEAEEEGIRGWDGWMASLMQWTWTWVNSGRWWGTEKPGVLHPWSCKESDMTGQLSNNNNFSRGFAATNFILLFFSVLPSINWLYLYSQEQKNLAKYSDETIICARIMAGTNSSSNGESLTLSCSGWPLTLKAAHMEILGKRSKGAEQREWEEILGNLSKYNATNSNSVIPGHIPPKIPEGIKPLLYMSMHNLIIS